MKLKREAASGILLALLFVPVLTSAFHVEWLEANSLSPGSSTSEMKFGIVYLSRHNHYELEHLPDEMLNSDFLLFKEQGLENVTLIATWKYLQPTMETYNEAGINELIRVCSFAKNYGLRVIIDFYTMPSSGSWTMPDWLPEKWFNSVFAYDSYRALWLNFIDHCASRLNGSSDARDTICSWHMMNEPGLKTATSGKWGCNATVPEFIQLWNETKDRIKKYSDRPVSVRFAAEILNYSTQFDCFRNYPDVYNVLDYVALNWYVNATRKTPCTEQLLRELVPEIQDHTQVVISEFGLDTHDWSYTDEQQKQSFTQYIRLFNILNITGCNAWMWRRDIDTGNYSIHGEGLNLAKDINGAPRAAFFTLSMGTLQGDVNIDATINLADLTLLANAYGSTPRNSEWNASVDAHLYADFDYNLVVGLTDLFIMAKHYGRSYP